jgi:hypothetical protein
MGLGGEQQVAPKRLCPEKEHANVGITVKASNFRLRGNFGPFLAN